MLCAIHFALEIGLGTGYSIGQGGDGVWNGICQTHLSALKAVRLVLEGTVARGARRLTHSLFGAKIKSEPWQWRSTSERNMLFTGEISSVRILFATRDFPPDALGGTEVYTAALAAGLQELGHEVSIVCVGRWAEGTRSFNGVTRDDYRGIPVTRIHLNWLRAPDVTRYLYVNPVVADYMQQYARELKPDVVHVTSCQRLSASVISVFKQLGIPVALSLTDFWFVCSRVNLVRSDGGLCDGQTNAWDCLECTMLRTKLYRGMSSVLPKRMLKAGLTWMSKQPILTRQRGLRGLATDMAERRQYLLGALRQVDYPMIATRFGHRLFSAVIPDKGIHLVPYGHDLSWLSQYGGKTPSSSLRIGYIGQLFEAKGVHLLIQAFRQLPPTSPVTLSVYGRLPQTDYGDMLLSLAEGDRRICFCGTYAHQESARVFANLDVLVIPSLWYDFPLVAHEAIAARTAIVATDLPGLNEIVEDGVTGLLFERANGTALASCLKRLAGSPALIGELCSNMGQVRTIHNAVSELVCVYAQLTSNCEGS